MTWTTGRIAAFDVETTGVDPTQDRIVTAALVVAGAGQPALAFTWLVNPGVPIAAEATAVHGITQERAEAEGADAATAVGGILELVREHVTPDMPLVAFNARFDLTMLDREARRHGHEPLTCGADAQRVIDPLVIDKWLDRYRRGSRRLDAVCEHYAAPLTNAHEAEADALAAARLAWRLGTSATFVARAARDRAAGQRTWDGVRGDLRALHAAQEGWAADQAVGLAAYFREKGDDEAADGVVGDWPVIRANEGSTDG